MCDSCKYDSCQQPGDLCIPRVRIRRMPNVEVAEHWGIACSWGCEPDRREGINSVHGWATQEAAMRVAYRHSTEHLTRQGLLFRAGSVTGARIKGMEIKPELISAGAITTGTLKLEANKPEAPEEFNWVWAFVLLMTFGVGIIFGWMLAVS